MSFQKLYESFDIKKKQERSIVLNRHIEDLKNNKVTDYTTFYLKISSVFPYLAYINNDLDEKLYEAIKAEDKNKVIKILTQIDKRYLK